VSVEHKQSSRPSAHWEGHLILLSRTDADSEVAVTSWVRAGLDARARIVYAEDAGRADGHAVVDILTRNGVDALAALVPSALERLPVAEFWAPGAIEAMCDEALSEGFASVRVLAVAADGVSELGEQGYLDAERGVDDLRTGRPLHALCRYAPGDIPDPVVAAGIAIHPGGVRETLFRTSRTDDALLISGEIDAHNDPLFGYFIEAVMDTAGGLVRLDFGDVTFIGVGGVRSIVRGSADFRSKGGTVELVHPSPDIVRLLRVLSVDELKGIEIRDGDS
jgi:anti-anti-sigma factor